MPYLCSCPLCCGSSVASLNAYASDDPLQASLVRLLYPPAPAATVINQVISGDSRVDALLEDVDIRLNSSSAPGTPVSVTYSFPALLPAAYRGDNTFGWRAFSTQQKTAVKDVLNVLQQQIGITFVEVADTPAAGGVIRFSNNTQQGSAGYAYLANFSETSLDSDVFISNRYSNNVTIGSYAWTTLVHEVGHALGLKHPGNYNAGQASSAGLAGNYLGVNEDAFYNSIMSYRDSAQGINVTGFMPYDLLALRYLYGTRAFETGNNTYTFTDASGRSVNNVVDDGGTDTLDFSAVTLPVGVDLTPGAYSAVGRLSNGGNAQANLTLSFGTVIENALGSPQADFILGNAANNMFTGGGGSDTLNGAAGVDTAVFSGPVARYGLTPIQYGMVVQDKAGVDGTDTLFDIERLRFSDTAVALDLQGHAGQVAKIIGAVFGKDALANTALVGAGLRLLDNGMSYADLGTVALRETGKTTPQDIVTLLWINLFRFTPNAEQIEPYVGYLNNGLSVSTLVMQAAEDSANTVNINLVGLNQSGLGYT